MALMTDDERAFGRAVLAVAYANPFLPERIELERQALGADFVPVPPVWHARMAVPDDSANVLALTERAGALAATVRERLAAGGRPSNDDAKLYQDVVGYLLYYRYLDDLLELVLDGPASTRRVAIYPRFARDLAHYYGFPGVPALAPDEAAHGFAFLFQLRRAFHFTFKNILGGSLPAARQRAAVWQSIFSHDLRRYRRSLWAKMHEVMTLVVGPSGSGKELVAQAIARSRYVPFDPQREAFVEDFTRTLYPLNL